MKLQFQKASLSQHKQIYFLMQEAFTPYVQKLNGKSVAGPYPWLKAAIEDGNVYVALEQKQIVGFATTRHEDGVFFIDQLGVNPAQQRNGAGSWLLNNIENIARQKHATLMKLNTAEMMENLLRLYRRHGFAETSKALPSHGEDEHLRVHMEKQL